MMSVAPLTIAPAGVPAAAAKSYVLLVDDHEPSLRRLEEAIRCWGHCPIAALSGAEALECCESRRPRVVVTDLAMPNLDGKGLARWLQARYPSVPLILMTGQEFDPTALGELERIFAAVLPKPVDMDRLLHLLDRLMPPPVPVRP
jgi:DNA-binding NtrC family response regulator